MFLFLYLIKKYANLFTYTYDVIFYGFLLGNLTNPARNFFERSGFGYLFFKKVLFNLESLFKTFEMHFSTNN
ncbi:MAG: hypothetical protein EGP82_02245 [Odoribacter splanchnicus]|nr:hypothetical protein [Odoribacter splanchnicus]MBD9177989.1 hypothetical protein [Odoribacter splanchnicus]